METAVLEPAEAEAPAGSNPIASRPDSLSGRLPGWLKTRHWTAASGKTTHSLRVALPASYALATQTAAYKLENDDATFVERLSEGAIIAGLFDGVTVPKRHHRAGHVVASFVRERLRALLVENEGQRPIVENVLASALEEAVGLLDNLGGGAATTATVLVATPTSQGEWRLYIVNAGNSRAGAFLPDGTFEPLTLTKPAGTSFAAINTLSSGYRYRREASKVTRPTGTVVLLTSDGVHDHVLEREIWSDFGRAVASVVAGPKGEDGPERLARAFVENTVARAAVAQSRLQRTDDATAIALVLGDPAAALDQKRRR